MPFPGTGSRSETARHSPVLPSSLPRQQVRDRSGNTAQYCLISCPGNRSETAQATLLTFPGTGSRSETARATALIVTFPGTGSKLETAQATVSSTALFLGQVAGQRQLGQYFPVLPGSLPTQQARESSGNTLQYCLVPCPGSRPETDQATISSTAFVLGQAAGKRRLRQRSPVVPCYRDR